MKNKIQQYLTIQEELNKLALDIFRFLKAEHIELLAFAKYSAFDGWYISKDKFNIKHFDCGYDVYESSYFRIPLKYIYEGTWKEYIESQDTKRLENLEKKKISEELASKEQELQLLQKLKEKYE